MVENEYLKDAARLINLSATHIGLDASYRNVIPAMTLFSFGIERLLKYILINVNPTFALKNGDFRHAAPVLYREKFVTSEINDQVQKKPDSEVVSFRVAMQRALLFSRSVQENKQLMYALAQYRDTLAHRPTTEIDLEKAAALLNRDGFPLVDSICQELDVSIEKFFGENTNRLSVLSSEIRHRQEFSKYIEGLLSDHGAVWERRKENKAFIEQASDLTQSLISSSGATFTYEDFVCPACGQEAVARIEPDYDYDDFDGPLLTGVFVDNIRCYFCGLYLEDYQELNYVDANSVFEAGFDQV